MNFFILLYIADESHAGGDHLSEHCGISGTGHAELRKTEFAKDQDGVKYDIYNRSAHLGGHAVNGSSRGLQQPLKGHLEKDTNG